MQEKTIKEQIDEVKGIKHNLLNPILQNKTFAWLLLGLSFLLMIIENFLKMDYMVGAWHMVFNTLLLVPLLVLIWKKELVNPYVKWFMPLLLLMMWDMFYYTNDLVQFVVPIVFVFLVVTLYLTSMQKVHSFYQTLLLRFELPWLGVQYIQTFLSSLFVKNDDAELYRRIGLALLITLPFLGVFVALLFSADRNFGDFLTGLVDFDFGFSMKYLVTVPLYFAFFLLLFIYGFSNHKDRTEVTETNALDLLIVGIFLGMINLLFMMFVAMQMPFLFGKLPEYVSLAAFAREGFFQLMMVMGIVLLISLFIMRRYKGEKVTTFLLAGLLVQTMLMGVVSLKKMYLYQSIKGATVMRYYVEWFDYFLLLTLFLGLVFLFRKLAFKKLLDMIALLSLFAFAVIISLNIDGMVASHNIEKFKDNPSALDKYALSRLSIDALPVLQGSDIIIKHYTVRNCSKFAEYHLGYCTKLSKYGNNNFRKSKYRDESYAVEKVERND